MEPQERVALPALLVGARRALVWGAEVAQPEVPEGPAAEVQMAELAELPEAPLAEVEAHSMEEPVLVPVERVELAMEFEISEFEISMGIGAWILGISA